MANTTNWVVANRDAWDVLYQESVAYYWNSKERNESPSLLEIYQAMGVSNIYEDGEGVTFFSENKEEKIVRVVPVFSEDKSDSYISGDAYTTKNGWSGLRSKLSIKIPNRVLVSNKVKEALEQVDFDKVEELSVIVNGKKLSELLDYLGNGTVSDPKEHVLSSFEPSNAEGFSIARIPALLTFIGVLESIVYVYKEAGANLDSSVIELFADIESKVYRPLTTLLSTYVSLGLFFPFGFNMSVNVGRVQNETLAGLRSNIKASLITDAAAIDSIDFSSLVNKLHQHYSSGDFVASSMSQSGDRGGAEGLNDDYAWEQFVPRVVAYNWHSLSSVDEKERREIIESNTSLRDYKGMLYSLGYNLPDFTDIIINLEDDLPFNISKDGGIDEAEWNFASYISELTVVYPTPPAFNNRPMALCDLIARRANEPFTSF